MYNSYSAKGLLAEICPIAIMVLMCVNIVDTAFEYAVIFVCMDIFELLITYTIYQLILISSDA